jgi:hypothetical protein
LGEPLADKAKAIVKACTKPEFLTRAIVAEAIREPTTSKNVNQVLQRLGARDIISESKGLKRRAIIQPPDFL